MLRDLRRGMSGAFSAFGFARRHGLAWLFAIPFALWLVFFLVLNGLLDDQAARVSEWLIGLTGLDAGAATSGEDESFWEQTGGLAVSALSWLIRIVVKLGSLILFFILSKYITLIALSPLLAWASERTEAILTGQMHPFVLQRFLGDVVRGALLALRNGLLELGINLILFFVTLVVPILAPITFVTFFLVSSWFAGFSMFDYAYERRRLGVRATVRQARGDRALVIGNGAVFSALMLLPFIGLIFGPLCCAMGAVITLHGGGDREWIAGAGTPPGLPAI